MKMYYINYGFLLALCVVYLLSYLILYAFFQPIFHSDEWVVFGSFISLSLVMLYSTKLFPLILKVGDGSVTFYGLFWIFKFRREWLEEVVVDTGGFIFKPKPEHSEKYRRVTELTSGNWRRYKVISFVNPKGLAEFVKVMRPITGDRIDWDRMSEKRKKYWWKLLYGSENEGL